MPSPLLRSPRIARVAILAAIALGGCAAPPAEPAGVALTPCRLAMPGVAYRAPAECGTVEVPLDRSSDDPTTLALRVAVVRSVSRRPAGDAVFLLAGGPGEAATEAYVLLSDDLEPLARQRDIVLVDQRGTGGSSPLDCPSEDPGSATGTDPAAIAEVVADCRAALGVDPRPFTTRDAVEDLEAVRVALGYEAVDLVGMSYGTRVAQSFARAYPARTRAMVLDGVVPQDLALGTGMAEASQLALDAVFARCQDDAACREAFDDPRAAFRRLSSASDRPRVVALDDPATAEPVTITLSAEVVDVVTRFLLYAPETAALLPLLYDQAGARSDAGPLAAQYLALAEDLAEVTSAGMAYTVVCSEDVPFYDPQAIAASNAGTYLGDLITAGLSAACGAWPVEPAPASFKAPLRSDVPTLLLSGEHDPVTPPAYAERVLEGLTSARHLVAPGQGHGVLGRGCMARLVAAFLEDLSPDALDAGCLSDLRPAPFFVGFTGPTP